jgi:hypothetical protein
VLHSAEHVFVELRPRVQIIEVLCLVSMLEVLIALMLSMFTNYNEFLAFVLGKFTFEQQLLF